MTRYTNEPAIEIGDDGWLLNVRRLESPNRDRRPAVLDVSLLLVHGISLPLGEFGGGYIEALFTNCLDCSARAEFGDLLGMRVSSHALIDRTGALTQFVSFADRAWHAGASSFRGRRGCNDFAIGVELEGTDDLPYTDPQYGSLAALARAAMARWPGITPDRIAGHMDVAPGRKTDPGPSFDWPRLRAALRPARQ